MKSIHALLAVAMLAAGPMVASAQTADAPPRQDPTTGGGDIGSTGSGTGDIGSTGSGTGDIGSTGSGTGDIGSTGSGTGDIGSTGSGTGDAGRDDTVEAAQAAPVTSLTPKSGSLRTPGTMPIRVEMQPDPDADAGRASRYELPVTVSSRQCSAPATVVVDWTSAEGGVGSFEVSCGKGAGQVVTVTAGDAATAFSTR